MPRALFSFDKGVSLARRRPVKAEASSVLPEAPPVSTAISMLLSVSTLPADEVSVMSVSVRLASCCSRRVSTPKPPLRMSLPPRPARVSLPAPPVSTLALPSPKMRSSPAEPMTLKNPPMRLNSVAAPVARSTSTGEPPV